VNVNRYSGRTSSCGITTGQQKRNRELKNLVGNLVVAEDQVF
jgi:hypothetical protein